MTQRPTQTDNKSVDDTGLVDSVVVDTDVHVDTPIDRIAKYMDAPSDQLLRGFDKTDRRPQPTSGWDPYMGEKITTDRSVNDAEETYRVLCEEFHIDYPILNALTGLSSITNTDLAAEVMKGANNMLLDRFLDERDNFNGLASLAPQAPHRAAEELDRLANEDSIVGAFMTTTHPNAPLGDPQYDPIYRAAGNNDFPVVFHGAASMSFVTEFPILNAGFEKFFSVHTLAHAFSQMVTLTSLVEHGTFEKFQELDFVFLEAGLGWLPYLVHRLNKEYSMRRSELPLLERNPESYINDSVYVSSQPIGEPNDPTDMKAVIDLVGVDSVMFATDYPHWDFDHPSALDTHLNTQFTPEEREQVLEETPREVFNLTA